MADHDRQATLLRLGDALHAAGAAADWTLLGVHVWSRGHGALASASLLNRLHLRLGDQLTIGTSTFVIRGSIDRLPGNALNFSPMPRVAIRYDDSALATQTPPIARRHPETGRTALFVSPGYTIGIEGLPDDEANALLLELFTHQARPQFVYRHRWDSGMLVLWDNRCLVHAATGGAGRIIPVSVATHKCSASGPASTSDCATAR